MRTSTKTVSISMTVVLELCKDLHHTPTPDPSDSWCAGVDKGQMGESSNSPTVDWTVTMDSLLCMWMSVSSKWEW